MKTQKVPIRYLPKRLSRKDKKTASYVEEIKAAL